VAAKNGGERKHTSNATLSETAKRNLESANTVWRDSSQYITLQEGEHIDLEFKPDILDGIVVKQDTFQGQLSGWKTFYQVVDINSQNTGLRTFKANRKSSKLINAELGKGNLTLRITRIGSGKDTFYQPLVIKR
jgi:hypothetical protein